MTITPTKWVPITLHEWVPITPITRLFERAIDLYNTHPLKIFEKKGKKSRKYLEISENLGNSEKVWKIFGNFWKFRKKFLKIAKKSIWRRGERCTIYPYNTHYSLIRACQWPPITPISRKSAPKTPIIKKIVGCYNHPSCNFRLYNSQLAIESNDL